MNQKVVFTGIVGAASQVRELAAAEISRLCQPDAKILDLGAGEGVLLNYLRQAGFTNLMAVDLENNFRLAEVDFKQVDLNKDFPFADQEFSAIVSSEVMEHIENPWHFAREIARILKPGGLAVITTPNVNNLLSRLGFLRKGLLRMFEDGHYQEWGHITPLSDFYLNKIFKKAGLEVIKHQYNTQGNFLGTKGQIITEKVLYYLLRPWLKGELGGDINIFTLRKV